MGMDSLLVVPSAAAAVSAPASRCHGLKDMGEKKLFPRGKNSVASRSKDETRGKLPAESLWGKKVGHEGWLGKKMEVTKEREKKGKGSLGRRNRRE